MQTSFKFNGCLLISRKKSHLPGLWEVNICLRVPLRFQRNQLSMYPNKTNEFLCTINYDLSKGITV